ncbi:hypothetical protein D3C81_2095470 [compost metagenome]
MSADDTERVSRHMIPAVPCMEVPYGEMGEAAFALLLQAMANRGETQQENQSEIRRVVEAKLFTGKE